MIAALAPCYSHHRGTIPSGEALTLILTILILIIITFGFTLAPDSSVLTRALLGVVRG